MTITNDVTNHRPSNLKCNELMPPIHLMKTTSSHNKDKWAKLNWIYGLDDAKNVTYNENKRQH